MALGSLVARGSWLFYLTILLESIQTIVYKRDLPLSRKIYYPATLEASNIALHSFAEALAICKK